MSCAQLQKKIESKRNSRVTALKIGMRKREQALVNVTDGNSTPGGYPHPTSITTHLLRASNEMLVAKPRRSANDATFVRDRDKDNISKPLAFTSCGCAKLIT